VRRLRRARNLLGRELLGMFLRLLGHFRFHPEE
jgi:hypothetical protein